MDKWGTLKSKDLPKSSINSLKNFKTIIADEPIVATKNAEK